jgi:predicted DsbA family dithiol-disulfide isomerase
LNQAIEQVLSKPLAGAPKPVAFSVIRVPFFLEPHYDENRPFMESNRERLVKKWGGKQGWERQKNNHDLKGRGREAGIPHFNLDRLTANTMASHRLIQHIGKTYGLSVSENIYDLLNVYYFVDGNSLNDRPKLASVVAAELKVLLADKGTTAPSEESLLKFLNGNKGRAEIEKALATLDELGVHSIPKFIIDHQMVEGAAGSRVFVELFRKIEKRGSLLHGPVFGDILGISKDTIEQGSHHRPENVAA